MNRLDDNILRKGVTFRHRLFGRTASLFLKIDQDFTIRAERRGDAKIGRRLYPLPVEARYEDVRVSPRVVYMDARKKNLVEGLTKTFTAMVEETEQKALENGMVD